VENFVFQIYIVYTNSYISSIDPKYTLCIIGRAASDGTEAMEDLKEPGSLEALTNASARRAREFQTLSAIVL